MLNDLRYAFRSFRRHPWFTALAIMTIALGIGPTTAILSLTNWSFLRPVAEAAANKEKWSVGHQLVQGLPWGSEKRSEQELLNDVNEEERTGDQRLVMALNDLAAWYRGQRRFQDAETTYKRVLKLQEGRMGANHYDTALSHNDLGVVYTESGKYPEAEQAFKRALDLWDKSWEMALKTEDNAVTFHNYSVLLDKLGRGAEAEDMEAKADDIMKKREDAIRGK